MKIDQTIRSPLQRIGPLLRQRREASGVSQRDLADLADVSVHTISDIERAKGNPTLEVIGKLADCLGLELALNPKKISPVTQPITPYESSSTGSI